MGLLDDAIRDHLELKRRRGAEPGELARVEREALDPGAGQQPRLRDGEGGGAYLEPGDEAFLPDHSARMDPVGVAPTDDRPGLHDELTVDADFPAVGQETAELDMQAVLGEDLDALSSPSPPAPVRPMAGTPLPQLPEERSLDWEMPETSAREIAKGEHVPVEDALGGERQERLSFE